MGIPAPNIRLENQLPVLETYLSGDYQPSKVPEAGNPDFSRFPKHTREVKYTSDGLIDPSVLLEYMAGPQCERLESPREHSGCKLEYHHLYFSAKKYKKSDHIFSCLRNSRYNQILIHSCQEDLYHQTHTEEVPLPDRAAAEWFLEEKTWLDEFAILSGGLAIARNKVESVNYRSNSFKVRALARLAIFEEMAAVAQEKLDEVELIHPSVVTGALVGYYNQMPEAALGDLVQQRLDENENILIPKIHTTEHIVRRSEEAFEKRVKKLGWTLQLLVKEPQSVAV